jgi:23S rRNA (cytosine1962-C5)-methyltransferase
MPATIVLKPRRARPFFGRHPWVYAHSVARIEGAVSPGDEVQVKSHEGMFIARGLFNPQSNIRVRLYRWTEEPLDSSFWQERLAAAVRLRTDVLGLGTRETAYRLVFSEGDNLSGLSVDRFDRWLVAHFSSLALYQRWELLLGHLMELTGVQGVIARADRGAAEDEGLSRQNIQIKGTLPPGPVAILENDLHYQVDLIASQKTGFYCDQRDNRRAVARHCAGKRVLDLFCFTGAFALNGLRHGPAASSLGVDSSGPALEQARRNAELNGLDHWTFEKGDVVKVLARLQRHGAQFDVVICDPPKYARSAGDLGAALSGYRRLNVAACGVLEPGGILASSSCSGLVDRRVFVDLLGLVAEESGRPIQILEQRGQGPDHPVSAACPESDYLKCMICRVG